MLVDDVRLDVADLGSHGQAVEDEVAQGVGVRHADVEEEVVGAGDVEDLDHLRHREGGLAERVDVRARVGADPHRHDRLEPAAEAVAVDVRVEAAQDTAGAERTDALEARRGGEADARGQLLVRDPRILLQRGHEGLVDSVESLFRHQFRISFGIACM